MPLALRGIAPPAEISLHLKPLFWPHPPETGCMGSGLHTCIQTVVGACLGIQLLPLCGALALFLGMQLSRARAWQNILRVSFKQLVPYKLLAATYLVGAGVNSVLPARAGEAVKLFLAKREIPGSSYPALASTLITLTVFDTSIGIVVLAIAIQQGVLQSLDLPSVSPVLWLGVSSCFLSAALVAARSKPGRAFLSKCRQGLRALGKPAYYLRRVASWQALGWMCRFAGFSLLLEAFGVSGSAENVLLVMSVQAVASLIPFAPGGAGTQQALLIATLGAGSKTGVVFYSVGSQIALTVFAVGAAFLALVWVFQTLNWKTIAHTARADIRSAQSAD